MPYSCLSGLREKEGEELIKFIAALCIIAVLFAYLLLETYREGDVFERRKRQNKRMLKENIVRKRISEFAVKKVKVSTRMKVEKLCAQAGYDLTYGDYAVVCVITALICSAIGQFVFSNMYLGVIFLFAGVAFPYQYFAFKRNRRIDVIEKQVGPCLKMIIERYRTGSNMKKAIEDTALEFNGEKPLSDELNNAVIAMETGMSISEALDMLAERTGNEYLDRFADYYRISADVGTAESKALLDQALQQYNEDKANKLLLKREVSAVKSEAYIVLMGIPFVFLYQCVMDDNYIHFMTKTALGQAGMAVVVVVFMVGLWFINKKIGAPLE